MSNMSERKVNLEEILKLHCNVADYDEQAILKAIELCKEK